MVTNKKRKLSLAGFLDAVIRYPLTFVFLVSVTLLFLRINHTDFELTLFTEAYALVIGAVLASLSQSIFERFYFKKPLYRWILYFLFVIITLFYYYFFLLPHRDQYMIIYIRSTALIAASAIAYIWVPSIKRPFSFERVFTIAFKAYFTTLLFSIVLTLGFLAILTTYSLLIKPIDFVLYADIMTIIFVLFSPIYFLSYIPGYSIKEQSSKTEQETALSIPKILEILISFIVIPLLTIYTLILMMYIIPNLSGQFWSDNLLEPLLISYAIIGFITLFVASNINNKITYWFNRLFPKILLIIGTFQTFASILKIQQIGVTHGRYYVVLFGLFTVIASLIYSFFKSRRSIVPAIFIGLSLLSIMPSIDAVSVGINSQINRLEGVLEKNDMLQDNKIVKTKTTSQEDRTSIIESLTYLQEMDALDRLTWLPSYFKTDGQFKQVFGFSQYEWENNNEGLADETQTYSYTNLELERSVPLSLDISGNDAFMLIPFSTETASSEDTNLPVLINDDEYAINVVSEIDTLTISLIDNEGEDLGTMDLSFLLDDEYDYRNASLTLPLDELTFDEENDIIKLTTIIDQMEIQDQDSYSGQFYVFINLK